MTEDSSKKDKLVKSFMSILYYVAIEIEQHDWKGLGFGGSNMVTLMNKIKMYHLGVVDLVGLTTYEIIIEINNTIDDILKTLKKLKNLALRRVYSNPARILSKCISVLEAYKDLLSLI